MKGSTEEVTCSRKASDKEGFHERNRPEGVLAVAAVGTGRGCRGVLALHCKDVDTNDKLQQIDVAN